MIFIILVLGLIFRLISLNQSLWLDEATSALVVRNFNFVEIITKFSPGDFHPPLYYLILKAWANLFGTSEIALRIPSVVFGLVTIYLIYLIGKSIVSKKVGLVAALVLATSGLHIYYSQEARMYSLVALLVSSLVYSFLKKKWFLFSMILVLTGMTDYPALLILPVFWFVGWPSWRKLVISSSLLIVSYLVWLPIFLRQLSAGFSAGQSAWGGLLGRFSLKEIALIPVKFMFGRISFEDKFIYGLVAITAGLLFGLLLIRAITCLRRQGLIGPVRNLKLLLLWLLAPIILAMMISYKLPILSYFRLLFVLPAFYLLIASGLIGLRKPFFRLGLVFLLFINLLSSGYYLLNPKFHREDWRGLALALGATPIVFPANSQKEALIYYGKEKQIINLDEIGKTNETVWLSRYVWEVFDPKDLARQKIESLGYNKTNEVNFNGVVVWQYEK